jgi:hypothetical protein
LLAPAVLVRGAAVAALVVVVAVAGPVPVAVWRAGVVAAYGLL